MNFKQIRFLILILFLSPVVLLAAGKAGISVTVSSAKVAVDGLALDLKAPVLITPEGKMYLSVEDIKQAFGKYVRFDPKSNTLNIGKMPIAATYLSDLKPINYETNYNKLNLDGADGPLSTAGQEFHKGIQFQIRASKGRPGEGWVEYNLDQKYTHLTGKVGLDDAFLKVSLHNATLANLYVYGDDSVLFSKIGVPVGEIHDVDVDVTNVIRLKIKAVVILQDGFTPVSPDVNFADMSLTAE